MRLNKTDGLTIGFITIAGFAILLNGIFREPPAQLTDQLQHPIDIEIGNIMPTEISSDLLYDEAKIIQYVFDNLPPEFKDSVLEDIDEQIKTAQKYTMQ